MGWPETGLHMRSQFLAARCGAFKLRTIMQLNSADVARYSTAQLFRCSKSNRAGLDLVTLIQRQSQSAKEISAGWAAKLAWLEAALVKLTERFLINIRVIIAVVGKSCFS